MTRTTARHSGDGSTVTLREYDVEEKEVPDDDDVDDPRHHFHVDESPFKKSDDPTMPTASDFPSPLIIDRTPRPSAVPPRLLRLLP